MDEQGIISGLAAGATDGADGLMRSAAFRGALAGALDGRPSALVIAEEAEDRQKLAQLAESAGARLLGAFDLQMGLERLDLIASVNVLVVQAAKESAAFTRLLARAEQLADADGTCVIMTVSPVLLDEAFGSLYSGTVQLLCSAGESDLAAAIAMAVQPASPLALHDIGRESEALRLQRLSEEVSRIARTLASLSGHTEIPGGHLSSGADGLSEPDSGVYVGEPGLDIPRSRASAAPITAREIRDLLRLRRLRDQFLPAEMFADPAWDMLLDLMAARLSNQRVSVSSLCIAAAVPATTALRWIRALTDNGLFLRQADPADGRRVFIALSEKAADAMTNYFIAAKKGAKAIMA